MIVFILITGMIFIWRLTKRGEWTTPEFLIVNAILIIKPIFLVMLYEVVMYLWKCHHHDLTLLSYASPHFQ